MNLRHFLAILLCAVILAGCRSSKKAVIPVGPESSSASVSQRFSSLVSSYGDWTDVNVPVNFDLTAPKSFAISGRAKMVRGKSIDISLRMIGFEVARIYVDNDSIFGMVKPAKTYMAESLADLLAGIPFTIDNLQDMLIGRIFLLGEAPVTVNDFSDFECELEGERWLALSKSNPGGLSCGFLVEADNSLNTLAMGMGMPLGLGHYGNTFVEKSCGPLAGTFNLEVNSLKTQVKAAISWRWRDAKWNEGASDSRWTTPAGYKRVKAADLVKGIQ